MRTTESSLADLNPRSLALVLTTLLLLPNAVASSPDAPEVHPFQSLRQDSPFGPPAPDRATTPSGSPVQELEFRGMLVEAGRAFFSIFDPATAKSFWVPLHRESDGFLVSRYDAKAEQITVARNGQVRQLELKRAVIRNQPPSEIASAPLGTGQAVPNSDVVPAKNNRLALIREELRRRRAEQASASEPR